MKGFIWTLASILIVLFSHSQLFGACAPGFIATWPKTNTIPKNPIFIVKGYGNLQGLVKKMGQGWKISLVSTTDTVQCFQTEFYKGQIQISQICLKPQRDLLEGHEYRFYSPKLKKWLYDHRKEASCFRWEEFISEWNVKGNRDEKPPFWLAPPKFKRKLLRHLACGPVAYAIFYCLTSDSSSLLVKALVRKKGSKRKDIFLLEPTDNEIFVGTGMCSAAFGLKLGKDFEVEFTLVDASGNETPWKGPPIKFQSPYKSGG